MKRYIFAFLMVFLFVNQALAVPKEFLFPGPKYKPPCDISKTTICTIEIWLANKHKKKKREIKKYLKSKSLKVLGHTVQYWRPKGGHPPTNIAIGSAVSAEDARLVIDFALKYNDRVDLLVLDRLIHQIMLLLLHRLGMKCLKFLLPKKIWLGCEIPN